MHTVLHLKSDWTQSENDETLEQRLRQTGSSSFLAHDDRTELTVITHKDELATTQHNRNHALGFGCLCAFVDQHRAESHARNARIARTDTCAADYVSGVEKVAFALLLEGSVALFVVGRQLPSLVLELLQLLQLWHALSTNNIVHSTDIFGRQFML